MDQIESPFLLTGIVKYGTLTYNQHYALLEEALSQATLFVRLSAVTTAQVMDMRNGEIHFEQSLATDATKVTRKRI